VASRLRWLGAAWILCVAAGAAAQTNPPLDLRLPAVSDGVVVSIREVHAASESAAPRMPAQPVGSPSGLEQAPPVGAVVYLPFSGASGGTSGDKGWRYGAAGTPDMQERFAQSAYELIVDMEDGERRSFRPRDPGRFRVGQRVTVRSGELAPKEGP
jgi:hypothetical protein